MQVAGLHLSPRPLPQVAPKHLSMKDDRECLVPASLSIPDRTSVESVIEVFSFILLLYYHIGSGGSLLFRAFCEGVGFRRSVRPSLASRQCLRLFWFMLRPFFTVLYLTSLCLAAAAQLALPSFPAGAVIPKVVCTADQKQSYALYLPSSFTPYRKWPIIYVFDPAARGQVAVEVMQTAAEKFGYIVAASNNSRNGPMGQSTEAANAMWQDTQQRFPIAEPRRYLAGMSGGARVATRYRTVVRRLRRGCDSKCGWISVGRRTHRDLKFAYYAAVGNADFNYGEFVDLRPKLDAAGVRYRIRIFDGQHGWAPRRSGSRRSTGWTFRPWPQERCRAIPHASGRLSTVGSPRPATSSPKTIGWPRFANTNRWCGISAVWRTSAPRKRRLAELSKDKAVKTAEKEEASALAQQAEMTAEPSSANADHRSRRPGQCYVHGPEERHCRSQETCGGFPEHRRSESHWSCVGRWEDWW